MDVSPIEVDDGTSAPAPYTVAGKLQLVTSWSPTQVLDADDGRLIRDSPAAPAAAEFQSGSNGVEVGPGWLFVVRESRHHRFALLDGTHTLTGVSPPFSIAGGRHETCWGAARRGQELVLAFGFERRRAGLAVMPLGEVLAFIEPCRRTAEDAARQRR